MSGHRRSPRREPAQRTAEQAAVPDRRSIVQQGLGHGQARCPSQDAAVHHRAHDGGLAHAAGGRGRNGHDVRQPARGRGDEGHRNEPRVSGTGAVRHVHHDGADTALWNVTLPPGARPSAPTGGQITAIRLEGCAEPAAGGPAPLAEIHFQALTPTGGGGVRVDVTSLPFVIPTCGAPNATRRTVTSYQPTNFCVSRGDIVTSTTRVGLTPTTIPVACRTLSSAPSRARS